MMTKQRRMGSHSEQKKKTGRVRRGTWPHLPGAADWDSWREYLTARDRMPDLAQLARQSTTHPLKWAVPDNYADLASPRLLKQLTRLATGHRIPAHTAAGLLRDWLTQAQNRAEDPVWALECLAWCHLLPSLIEVLPADPWRAAYRELFSAVEASAGLSLHDDPVRHQLLQAELAFALAYQFPELVECRALITPAMRAVSFAIAELLDGEGVPHAAYVPQFRSLLACWTRCSLMASAKRWKWCDAPASTQFEWAVRQTLRLSRPDGSLILSRSSSGDWCPGLILTALEEGGDRDDLRAAEELLPRPVAEEHRRPTKSPVPSVHSEWGQVCLMRTQWSRKSPYFACLFHDGRLQSELATNGRVLWSGDVTPTVVVDGQRLESKSSWTDSCWFSDEDIDYLELEIELQDGWQIQRQMLLARRDAFLLVADAVLGPQGAAVQHETTYPLADGIRFEPESETRDGTLVNNGCLAAVLPLALPEWRAAESASTLDCDAGRLRLTHRDNTARMYVPLWFDLNPQRARKQRTWRRLTVAERMVTQPADVAVGYRIQSQTAQWLVYRSLAACASRSVLGQNYVNEFAIARFDTDGVVDELIQIE